MIDIFKTKIIENISSGSRYDRGVPNRIKLILDIPCMTELQRLICFQEIEDVLPDDIIFDRSIPLATSNIHLLSLISLGRLAKDNTNLSDDEKAIDAKMNSLVDEFIDILDKMLKSNKIYDLSVMNIVDIHYINLYGLLYIEFDKTVDEDNNIFTNVIINSLNDEE